MKKYLFILALLSFLGLLGGCTVTTEGNMVKASVDPVAGAEYVIHAVDQTVEELIKVLPPGTKYDEAGNVVE